MALAIFVILVVINFLIIYYKISELEDKFKL